MTYLQVNMPLYDIWFSVYNSWLAPKLKRMMDPSTSPRNQLRGYFSVLWLFWNGNTTYSGVDLPSFLCHDIVSWQLATYTQNCFPQKNEGSFKHLQANSWKAIPACFNCSEWSTQLTYRLKCQLTIADSCSNCLPQKNYSSFKPLQGSGWPAIQACSDCF